MRVIRYLSHLSHLGHLSQLSHLGQSLKKIKKEDIKDNNQGYMTTEAAIALPIFLCVVLTFIIFIKVIFVHEVIQHALDQTASEISEYSYLYGAFEIDELLDLSEISDNISNSAASIILDILLDKGMDDLKNSMLTPIIKNEVQKYLQKRFPKNLDSVLKNLGIRNGISGLDFEGTTLLADDANQINLQIKYDIDMPIPIKLISSLHIKQSAIARAWMKGDSDEFLLDSGYFEEDGKQGRQEDVWSLGNFERGKKIRSIFGANLPESFPVIAYYSKGTAKMIKSMDLTSYTYQNPEIVSIQIREYIDRLKAFNGLQAPWGSKNIEVPFSQIKSKQLLLIIPSNNYSTVVDNAMKNATIMASENGILMTVVRYGFKEEESQAEKSQTDESQAEKSTR